MIPVAQTIFTAPKGDCFRACVASIFELPIDAVPHFFETSAGDHMWTQEQWDAVRSFAERHDTEAHWVDPDTEQSEVAKLVESGLHYVAFGPSPSTPLGHCVVMHKGEYVHDPSHGRFLGGEPWLYVLFNLVEVKGDEDGTQV